MPHHTISILKNAQREIEFLRRQNEILHAKVDTMNFFRQVLNTEPHNPAQGMSPDIVWEIQNEINALEQNQTTQPPQK